MKILVTGFDPFGGEHINPSYEVVKSLPENIAGAEIIKYQLPTEYIKSGEILQKLYTEYNPDIILSVGQAGGRSGITVEKVAINFAESTIPDNSGYQPVEKEIIPDGDTGYFTNLPIKSMVQGIIDAGVQGNISYTAGTFVCNSIMYHGLNISKHNPSTRAGFIHVPYLPEQTTDKKDPTPSMSHEDILKGLVAAIEAIVHNSKDSTDTSYGTTH